MMLEAKARLLLSENEAVENLRKQVKLLKNSLPSRQNRRSMSQIQRLNTRQQILTKEQQIVNERRKELTKKGNS